MIFVTYYRQDLISKDPIEVYSSVLTVSKPIDELHEQAIEFAQRHPTATSYKLFEGPHFKSVVAISLEHSLK